MPWLVRFRGKEFTGNEGCDPEFEDEVLQTLTDKRELSGSAEIILQLKGDFIDDVIIHESTDPDKFPLKGIHGNHVVLGEVFIFSGVPDEGEGEVIALYSNNVLQDGPFNNEPFTGDGAQNPIDEEPRLLWASRNHGTPAFTRIASTNARWQLKTGCLSCGAMQSRQDGDVTRCLQR